MKYLRLTVFALTLAVAATAGSEPAYRLGEHYEPIAPPVPTENTGPIEVVEVFWYGCSHCFDFEHYLQEWLKHKPADVVFRRVPGIFSDAWVPHARAYYTAELLGIVDAIHGPMFDALHKDKRPLKDEASLTAFFGEHGVAEKDFLNAYDSFSVDGKVRQAAKLSREYGISGVPSMIINGKYRSSARLAGDFKQLLKVVDHLIEAERHP